MSSIADKFANDAEEAWTMYFDLPDWATREEVVRELSNRPYKRGFVAFMEKYKQRMEPYIREDFYNDILFNPKQMKLLASTYQLDGNVEVPFLNAESLGR